MNKPKTNNKKRKKSTNKLVLAGAGALGAAIALRRVRMTPEFSEKTAKFLKKLPRRLNRMTNKIRRSGLKAISKQYKQYKYNKVMGKEMFIKSKKRPYPIITNRRFVSAVANTIKRNKSNLKRKTFKGGINYYKNIKFRK